MSIIENGKKIAGNYKVQLAPEATTEKSGVIRIATDQDIQDGTSEKLAVTPKQLNSYVSKDDISEVAKTGSYNDLIDVPEQYSLPIASTVELGGVKVDGNTINIDESGIISVGNLDNKANVSLSNLDAIGEAKIGSALNNKITNCLTEIPQRIKYTLEDGTLTIKAGSVVIVPYGTEIVGNSSDEPEIVGTLTVDAEGGYSGFSYPNVFGDSTPENYILAPILDKADYSKVEYLFKFKMGEEGGGLISSSDSTETLVLGVDPSGLTFMDGMVQFFHSSETPIFISGNTYWVKVLTQNGQRTTVFVSNDGKTYNELVDDYYDPEYDYSEDTSVAFLDGVQNIIGVYVSMGSFHLPFDGTLYVKESYIKIDDEPFWSFEPPTIRNLAEECPIGSKFLNDNFIVVGTQQADGKCFVWAEVVNDLSSNYTSSTAEAGNRMVYLIFNLGTASWYLQSEKINYCFSGTQGTTTTGHYSLYYNTNTNLCARYNSSAQVIDNHSPASLPCLVVYHNTSTGIMETVPQVFNGMGYIGSTIWVDKGVKGLIPNGRNEDGTLNNIEFTTKTLKTFGYTGSVGHWFFGLNENGDEVSCLKACYYEQNSQPSATSETQIWYNPLENKFYYSHWQNTTNFIPEKVCIVAHKIYDSNKNITLLQPKQAFRAVDYNDVDGKLVISHTTILGSTSIAYNGSITCDLSNYLPNDGNVYEVDCSLWATSETASNSGFNIAIISDYVSSYHAITYNVTRTEGKTAYGSGTCKIPVGAGRYIKITNNISSGAGTSKVDMQLHSYRKVR